MEPTISPSRAAVFIDNSNILNVVKKNLYGHIPPYCKLYCPKYLAERLTGGNKTIVYIGFYCAPPPSYLVSGDGADKNRYAMAMKYYGLIEKMDGVSIHYATVNGTKGSLQEKNLDTKMTADIISMAAQNKYDTAIIVSNDADFVSAVQGAQGLGKRVEVAYFKGYGSFDLRQKSDLPRKLKPGHFRRIDGFTGQTYVPREELSIPFPK